MTPAAESRSDPLVTAFLQHLRVEKDASPHTISNYLGDLWQFTACVWGEQAQAPFAWAEADRFAARKFLVKFQQDGAKPATTNRKLSSLRTFYKFLVRENHVRLNPFAALPAPRRDHRLPQVLSTTQVGELLDAPARVRVQFDEEGEA